MSQSNLKTKKKQKETKETNNKTTLVLIKNKEVLNTINKYLNIRNEEKKLFGEVFTPVKLICEMLDKLPSEVWKDSKLKWLDPASGIGNFAIVVYYKLMEGLKNVKGYDNEHKRSKHIIENMLYMVELNPVNVKVCRKIFKLIHKNVTPNISNSNFLTEDKKWKRHFKNDKYDIIMGNPPYQKQKKGESIGHANTQPIWPDFIEQSLNKSLKNGGFLVFVNPSGWRDLKGQQKKIFKLLQERDLQHLVMRSFKDGAEIFGGSATNFDYYSLKNTLTNTNKTKINDIDRNELELNLNNFDFIPSGKFKVFKKLINTKNSVKMVEGSIYHIQKSYVKDIPKPDKEFKYPVVYTITQKGGIKCRYTNKKRGMFVPKVMWSDGVGTYPVIDKKGKYGLTQFGYGIQDDPKVLEYIRNAMNDPKFIDLMNYVKFGKHKYNRKIISSFKKEFWKEFDYKTEHKSKRTKKKINNI